MNAEARSVLIIGLGAALMVAACMIRLVAPVGSNAPASLIRSHEVVVAVPAAPPGLPWGIRSIALPEPFVAGGLHSGLVAYWQIEGNGLDSSGHHNDLELYAAGPTASQDLRTFPPALIGRGMSPGLAVRSYLCPGCGSLSRAGFSFRNSSENPDDFTISAWALSSRGGLAADRTWWSYAVAGNDQLMLTAQSTGSYPTPAYPTMTLTNGNNVVARVQNLAVDFRSPSGTGAWVHLVGYRRGDVVGLLVNGQAATSFARGSVGTAGRFWLGQMGTGYPWQGELDEVTVWSRALSPGEMRALYLRGAGFERRGAARPPLADYGGE